ncbi:alpha/beta fold hydrolase [Novosphingobium mangrovi (ex Huang et al. 2023)]|uniref:Alpha/beta fold hydrolase n=1 Tax=Novosphingobium mangrovi (ex Huang et al. 2023) TaxID=2976432 RepID=A0ABT2I6T5_9SPHN|nr:alpha/beta fold hydrolase [Novosphingobium mangrovi (ex Huang et al. 2023)]MCT2400522.1 alpha/beta fold hydrolase [Novosphingobium mangrovi (ex Huang et al. 2023)]
MATFVLVHGGMHGGWCYTRLAALLREAGHEVHCPTLSGLGERRHMLHAGIDLDTHIEDIASYLFHEDLHDVYLAGHSYGGMVITGVADKALERVGHLVFLDASHPRDGESLTDVAPGMMDMAHGFMRVENGVEVVELPDEVAVQAFGLPDPEDYAWAKSRLSPQPWKCFTQKLRLTREAEMRRIPRTSINCTPTLAVRPDALRHRSFEADHLFEIDTGHDLMLTEPRKVADMLIEVVARSQAT